MPKNALPTVSSDIPKDLRYFIDRVAEVLTSNGPNQFLTLQDLRDGKYNDALDESGGGGTDDDDDDVIIPVLGPPKPTGVLATGGYEYIILEWDRPEYYGHAFSTIYRAAGENASFSEAQSITSVEGRAAVFSDYLGTGVSATYWVSFTNINGVEGPISDPSSSSTAINVEEVLDVLTGALTSTEFVDDLSTFLDNAPDNYVVKLAGEDGAAAGFGLASTDRNGNIEFDFAILADNFFITPPVDYNQTSAPTGATNGQIWRVPGNPAGYYVWKDTEWVDINPSPFIVRTTDTTLTNEDGEEIDVPAGVYIRDGYIQNGTITNAKIGTAAIDNAKIANATITDAKIGFLDAGKIQTGEFQSFDFENSPGKGGFRLAMGIRLVEGPNGEFLTNQEDVEFILRGALDPDPALQLVGGVTTINALNIRNTLQSRTWPTTGFSFNVETGVYAFKNGAGDTIFTTNGFDGNAVEDAIRETIDALNAVIGTKTPQTQFNSLLDTVNDTTSGLASKAPLVDLQDTNDSVATIDEQITDLNDDLLQVGNFDENGNYAFDPAKIGLLLSTATTQEQLEDYQFILAFAEQGLINSYYQDSAFINLFAANAIFKDLYAEKAIFGEILADSVAANNGVIDNLVVDTLQIANEAVFVPVAGGGGGTVGSSWVRIATSTPITWDSLQEKPGVVIINGSAFFQASNSSSDGTACSVRVGIQYPNGGIAFGGSAAVSTRKDYSQSVTAIGIAGIGPANGSQGVTVIMDARTSSNGDGFSASGAVVGFAGRR